MVVSHRAWPRAAAVVLLAVVVVVVLAVGLGVVTVRRGWVDGPAFAMRLGDYHLIARTTTRPECLPLTQHECFVSFPNPPSNAPAVYAIWAGHITQLPAVGAVPRVTVSRGRRLLSISVMRGGL